MFQNPDKPTVVIYVRYFLSPSETFIYRQLQGVSHAYDPLVITSALLNPQLYPIDNVCLRPRTLTDRITARLQKMLTGRFSVRSAAEQRDWYLAIVDSSAALIHAHFGTYGLDMLAVARRAATPLLVTFHGFDASSLLNDDSYVRALRELFQYAHVITVSRNMADRLRPFGLDEAKLYVHYIGVPIENFDFVVRKPVASKIAAGEPVHFVQVSNFVEKKGHEYTVDAFARYLRNHPGHTLTLAGDGPLLESTRAACGERGIADRVRFPGRVVKDEVRELMMRADVFVHHSVTGADGDMEGIPTVIMEAMSTGLVVIATHHSGISELVDDGREGYLVPERDVDAYVERLQELANSDPDLPRRARHKIETSFNMAVQNEKLVDIYRKVSDVRQGS